MGNPCKCGGVGISFAQTERCGKPTATSSCEATLFGGWC